jgi:hypothetical protein
MTAPEQPQRACETLSENDLLMLERPGNRRSEIVLLGLQVPIPPLLPRSTELRLGGLGKLGEDGGMPPGELDRLAALRQTRESRRASPTAGRPRLSRGP